MTTKLIGELSSKTLDYLFGLSMQTPKTKEEYDAFSDLQGKIFWFDDLKIPTSYQKTEITT